MDDIQLNRRPELLPESSREEGGCSRPERVLIVDPTSSGAQLGEALAPACEVWLARRFDEALAVLATSRCTAVVTELALGDRTAFDLLDWVSVHSPETRVIVATVFASVYSAQAALRRGAWEVLTKPVTGADVLSALGLSSHDQRKDASATMTIDDACLAYISEIFDRCGSLARTAQLLGMDRRSLRRMLARIASARGARRDP
jgi:two-component system response regulator RegA